MTIRRRLAVVCIAGLEAAIEAPGLKQIKRRNGVNLYWAKDDSPLFADYRPATVRIHVDLSDPRAVDVIKSVCIREQTDMELWLESRGDDRERLRPKFNGTIGSLCSVYESDPASGYADLQGNTKSSYRDSLKIIRETIGLRRIDVLQATYFRTCYRNWRQPKVSGEEDRVRRAYGCIQLVKIVLGYGMEANLFYAHCDRLLRALSKMRFAKNPPRGVSMTFEQAKAIVCEALEADDVSTALVQALQFECFLRQIDIVGKWRVEPENYRLKDGEIRRGGRVWKGMTMGMILNDNNSLRVRTSKTSQFVEHAVGECELVQMCLDKIKETLADAPVARRPDGSPWNDHRDFGRNWRCYANNAEVPKNVWNMDNRASGITEATAAGVSHDDLAGTAAHASKATTRKIYMRGAKEISTRVQSARQSSRRAKSAAEK